MTNIPNHVELDSVFYCMVRILCVNKYIAEWVSKLLEFDNDKKDQYIQEVIKADFAEAGNEDVFRKIKIDLKNKNIEDDQIRLKMKELNEKAKSDFM